MVLAVRGRGDAEYTSIHFYDFLWQNAHRGKKEEN